MRSSIMTVALLVAACAANSEAQGGLAARVAQTRDGEVRMTYDSRVGVCGDGRDLVSYRKSIFARDFEGTGTMSDTRCVMGPVRVSLTMDGGKVAAVRTQIGGAFASAGGGRVTDLGRVAATDAAAYFYSQVPALEQSGGKRVLLPAVLADDPAPLPPLLSLARDERRTREIRRQSILWLGLLGDASVVPTLVGIARAVGESEIEKKSVSVSAIMALSQLEDGVGVPALVELSHERNATVRRETAFWLGQTDDPRAESRLHEMIADTGEEQKVRAHAIFSLSQGQPRPSRFRYLRDVYARLDGDALKESVIQGMGQDLDDGVTWLLALARDSRESVRLRKSALFWAGQRNEASAADIVSVYRSGDVALREHALFVLAQRSDDQSLEALMRIARSDDDTRMRGRALFWLAQKHDARVTRMIADLVTR